MATYDTIHYLNPDLILLEAENVHLFADPDTINKAVDPGDMALLNKFYGDAAANTVEGYELLFKEGFGYVLIRDGLYEQYFKP